MAKCKRDKLHIWPLINIYSKSSLSLDVH